MSGAITSPLPAPLHKCVVIRCVLGLLAHITHGPRNRESMSIATQLSGAIPALVGLLSANSACCEDAASCLGSLAREGKLKREIANAVSHDQAHDGGAVSAAARLGSAPRRRVSTVRGASWNPKSLPGGARTGQTNLYSRPQSAPIDSKKGGRRLADGSIEKARGAMSASVEMSGYEYQAKHKQRRHHCICALVH